MLDGHSDLAVVNRSNTLADFARRARRYERPGGFRTEAFLAYLFRHPGFPYLEVAQETVRVTFGTIPPHSVADALRRCFGLHATARGKARWGEKGLDYVLEMARVASLLPEARFIHVVRDGRDVARALVDSGFGADNLVTAAGQWAQRVERGRRAGGRLGPQRYRELRYEDLVADPEAALQGVCRFLDLDYEPTMLDYHARVAEQSTGAFATHHRSLRLPPTPGLRDWRRDLTATETADIEAVVGRTLSACGYPQVGSRTTAGSRLRAVRRRAVIHLRHQILAGERLRRLRRDLASRGPQAPTEGD